MKCSVNHGRTAGQTRVIMSCLVNEFTGQEHFFCKSMSSRLRLDLKVFTVFRVRKGGKRTFQHLVAANLNDPRNATDLCLGVTKIT